MNHENRQAHVPDLHGAERVDLSSASTFRTHLEKNCPPPRRTNRFSHPREH